MDEATRRKLADHEARLQAIEQRLQIYEPSVVAQTASQKTVRVDEVLTPVSQSNTPSFPNFTFTQVISVLGIVGIIIGALSFFFYAVANRLIGETGQILIGMIAGLILFVVAYMVRDKKPIWSNIVFGGAFVIEYIAIAVGVLAYETFSQTMGVILCIALFLGAIAMALKFDSKAIAYFAIVGGYALPFLTGTYAIPLFVLTLYLVISAGLVVVAAKREWSVLRIISFFIVMFYCMVNSYNFTHSSPWLALFFIIGIFFLYHISCLVRTMADAKNTVAVGDIIILAILPLFVFSFVYPILHTAFNWSLTQYGLLVLVCALAMLGEVYMYKTKGLSQSAIYALMTMAFIALNVGILFFVSEIQFHYFIILFAIQQALFAYLAIDAPEKTLYNVFSYIFLGLTSIWMIAFLFITNFTDADKIIVFIIALATTISLYVQNRKSIDTAIAGPFSYVSGYFTIFLFFRMLELVIINNDKARHIVLSVLWLAYTIYLYTQSDGKSLKIIAGILFGITLLKIIFLDFSYLDTMYRIVGFIIFGILLLAAGYWFSRSIK